MMSMDGWLFLAAVVFTVFVLIAAFQAWCLWKVRRALAVLLPLEERVTRLNYSLGLLVDTTQGCFDALAAQVGQRAESPQPAPTVTAGRPATANRQQRQRRVVGAAKRGRTVAQIAAEEAVAEGEVALRVQMARDLQASCELT
jgi:hypothetical protein